MLKLETKFIDAGEVRLRYVEVAGDGPPLVLIPAQIAQWETYEPVLQPLARVFHVFVIELRGHGGSSWTTGDYSWASVGRDMRVFLTRVVGRPALLSGNSSGGIVGLWCAANVPELTAGIVLEDAPVFSAEMPRFRDRDRFVYRGLKHIVDRIGNPRDRRLGDYFRGLSMPREDGGIRRIPNFVAIALTWLIGWWSSRHPGEPVEIPWLPRRLRLLIKSLSQFDPDFSRAFVDCRFYQGIDHADALSRVNCPMLVLHADWFRTPDDELVGAMDDDDARRLKQIVPHAIYRRVETGHVIHTEKPDLFVDELVAFGADLFPPEDVSPRRPPLLLPGSPARQPPD